MTNKQKNVTITLSKSPSQWVSKQGTPCCSFDAMRAKSETIESFIVFNDDVFEVSKLGVGEVIRVDIEASDKGKADWLVTRIHKLSDSSVKIYGHKGRAKFLEDQKKDREAMARKGLEPVYVKQVIGNFWAVVYKQKKHIREWDTVA
jgi:hypothetical protein